MGGGGRDGSLSRLVTGSGRRLHPFFDPAQIVESARKHRTGQAGLLLVTVDADRLGDRLKWEKSRGGDLFPHLYGALDPAESTTVRPLPLGPDGLHMFPELPQ